MFGKKLKELRENNGYSMDRLVDIYNKRFNAKLNKSTLSRYENGLQDPMYTVVVNLASLFNVSVDYLTCSERNVGLQPPGVTEDVVSIPVIGEIAAGYDKEGIESWSSDSIDIPRYFLKGRKPEEFFFLTVKGESMYPEYRDGDKVLILRQETLNYSGQVGAVVYGEGNATLKKVEFVTGEDWMNLVAINPTVPPKRIEGPDLEKCRILGIPKYLIREYE